MVAMNKYRRPALRSCADATRFKGDLIELLRVVPR